MRRRLIVLFVGIVASALAVTAALSFFLIAADARRSEERSIAAAARRVAQRGSSVRSLETVGLALDLKAAAQLTLDIEGATLPELGNSFDDLPVEVLDQVTTASAIANLGTERTISGITGDWAWAASPTGRLGGERVEAIVLARAVPDTAARALRLLGIASIAALVASAIAAVLIARGISRPLREATAAYRRIAAGDLSLRQTRDSRDRKRTDEVGELTRSLDTMTGALQRARDQERSFLMSVSHDLRTPLTSIRGYAEAIAEGTAPDDRRAAEVIGSESRRLERLVRDLLDLAKLEADQFSLSIRPADITDIVTDAADGFLPTAARVEVILELDAQENVSAQTDPERLMQIIANLTENALKFARSRVVVGLTASAQRFEVTIADDGPGIDPADLPRVFDRSFTSDRHGARTGGSGLGLAIVKELAVALGGDVTVTTSTDGTTFTVQLPVTGRDGS
jgi:two-component system, OmpR family, sensor kinase